MATLTKSALVVDDNFANRDFLARLLATAGFDVLSAANATSALDIAQAQRIDLAVIDMELPDMNGIHLTGRLRELHPETHIVVATMHDERSLIDEVVTKGANVFLVKPHGFMELYKRLTTTEIVTLCQQPFTVIDQFGARAYQPVAANK